MTAIRSDVFVYICGPMTAKNGFMVEENLVAGLRMYLQAVRCGIPSFCPHLGGAFPSAWDIEWETWLNHDFAMIDRCTHVLLLPRWETSDGAQRERRYALLQGKSIIESLDEI